jgi:hypothetical protein
MNADNVKTACSSVFSVLDRRSSAFIGGASGVFRA